MSEGQKISIEAAIKIWGGIISLLLTITLGLMVFIYQQDRAEHKEFKSEMKNFIRNQTVINSVLLDLITDIDPESRNKIIPYTSRHESMITRGGGK